MDKSEIYILETKDKEWAVIKKEYESISNYLSIKNANKYSNISNFKKEYSTKKSNKIFSSSKYRRDITYKKLNKISSEKEFFKVMRSHFIFSNPLYKGSKYSPCMHSGVNNKYQTTSSMVVILKDKPIIWFTGCSLPCISMYKPYRFGDNIISPITRNDNMDIKYWTNMEKIHRTFIEKKIPKEFYLKRDEYEEKIIEKINNLSNINTTEILEECLKIELELYNKLLQKY